jgi:hypothetical protein
LRSVAQVRRTAYWNLIAVQSQLAVMSGFTGHAYDRDRLREMTLVAVEPILALHQAIHIRYSSGVGGGAGCDGGCAWLAMTRMDSARYCPFPMQQVSISLVLGNRVRLFPRDPVALRGWIIGSRIRR